MLYLNIDYNIYVLLEFYEHDLWYNPINDLYIYIRD